MVDINFLYGGYITMERRERVNLDVDFVGVGRIERDIAGAGGNVHEFSSIPKEKPRSINAYLLFTMDDMKLY